MIICLSSSSKSQTLTSKDLKLQLDGKEYSDSTITVDEILKAKKKTANFSWIFLEEIAVYLNGGKGFSETDIVVCSGNSICEEAKKEIKTKMKSGCIIIFQANQPTNKSGQKIEVQDLVLYIK